MDYKIVEAIPEGVVIRGVKNFELPHIFDCGQCFRWERQQNGNYIGVAFGKVIELEKSGEDVTIYNSTLEDFNGIWEQYFDLQRDYSVIKEELSEDPLLNKAVEYGYGIRLLQQDPFEITLSFIISARNSIPVIMKTIKRISEAYGRPLEYKGKTYYAFPTPEELKGVGTEAFEACGASFRSKYLSDTVAKVNRVIEEVKERENTEGQFLEKPIELQELLAYDLNAIKALDADTCHIALQNFSGIGPKVADCIMLFSMGKYSAFPVDVWVKRAMQHFYLAPDVSLPKMRIFAREKFGELSGFAQQYLFYYARENNIQV